MIARDESGQVFPALFIRAVQLDLIDAEVGVRAVGQRDRGRGARDFLNRDHMGEIGHARAAEFFRHGDPEKAEIAHLFPKCSGKFVARVDLGCHGFDPLLGEPVHHIAQGIHVLAQIERHRRVEHADLLQFIEQSFIKEPQPARRVKHGNRERQGGVGQTMANNAA